MKKSIITSLSVLALAITFTGCGGSGSVTGASDDLGALDDLGGAEQVVVSPVVDQEVADVTTQNTPYNLSSKLGTPPGLPN